MITSKNGDDLYTSIKDKQVRKDSEVIELLGCFDETIAIVMLADNYSYLTYINEITTFLTQLAGVVSKYNQDFDTTTFIKQLEDFIFSYKEQFSFLYPIRQEKKLYINLARTKVRQLERKCCHYGLAKDYLVALNRLSDYLYIELAKCK